MTKIIILPFKIPGDKLVDMEQKIVYNVCRTLRELYDEIKNVKYPNKTIFTYVFTYECFSNKYEVYYVNYHGELKPIFDALESEFNIDDELQRNESLENITYPNKKDITNPSFLGKDIDYDLKCIACNSLLEKLNFDDVLVSEEKNTPIRTCLDLLRHIAKVKFKFLENVCMTIQTIPRKMPVASLYSNSTYNIVCYDYYETASNKSLRDIAEYLDKVKLKKEYIEDENDILLEDSKIEQFTFYTPSGHVIEISTKGEISIKTTYLYSKYADMYKMF